MLTLQCNQPLEKQHNVTIRDCSELESTPASYSGSSRFESQPGVLKAFNGFPSPSDQILKEYLKTDNSFLSHLPEVHHS
jgi:hypothetical protein